METKGSLLTWRLTLAETIGACMSVAAIVLWLGQSYQSKEDASKMEQRISSIENRIDKINEGIIDIAKDTAYIRGKLEPKK